MNYKHISKTVYKVHDFISWQRNGSLILSPSFQRRPVWNQSAKSYLIDTVVKGLPIPIIFIREKSDLRNLEPSREIVDGQQRLRTLISYIQPNLLSDLKPATDLFKVLRSHNKELGGKEFKELNTTLQQRILNYEFSVHVLPSETEDSEVLQIFARMNSTGVKLNYQELRNAKYFGEFKETMYNIGYQNLNRWRKWNIFNETDIARMSEVEEVSDLVNIMINGLKGRSQTTLDNLYKEFDDEFSFSTEVERRFNYIMDKIDETVGDYISHSPFSRSALFNTLFIFYYDIAYRLNSKLEKVKPNEIDSSIIKTINNSALKIESSDLPEELQKVLRGGTNNLESRKIRLKFIQDIHNAK
jgi:uncharacterized protein with ParB-like and HNH nuclease domain